jgi:hypothetical protein
MFKKRGIYVAIGGVAMIVASFAIAMSIVQRSDLTQNEFFIPDILEGMFDEVSDRTQLEPSDTVSFSFDATTNIDTLLWGIQILDYQSDDKVLVSISNIFGDNFGQFNLDQPTFFETMKIEKNDIYNFMVENKGNRPITVVMMFTKNPNDSKAFSDPNSPFSQTLVPLAVSGTLLIIGIIAIIIGVIVIIIDYRKRSSEFV